MSDSETRTSGKTRPTPPAPPNRTVHCLWGETRESKMERARWEGRMQEWQRWQDWLKAKEETR